MKYVLTQNRRHFLHWCRINDVHPRSPSIINICTDRDLSAAERLMGIEITEEDEVIIYETAWEGRYMGQYGRLLRQRGWRG